MEILTIDGQPRIVTMNDKKEVTQSTAEAIQQARKKIDDGKFMLTSLANTRAEQQDRLESALLNGGSTAGARKELLVIQELEEKQTKEINDALRDIDQVERLIDRTRADEIMSATQAAIVAICQPFDDFLKEHHV